MSEEPAQEYFSDGMSEDIIISLSQLPHIFVIARLDLHVQRKIRQRATGESGVGCEIYPGGQCPKGR